jgi:hypothetical protein
MPPAHNVQVMRVAQNLGQVALQLDGMQNMLRCHHHTVEMALTERMAYIVRTTHTLRTAARGRARYVDSLSLSYTLSYTLSLVYTHMLTHTGQACCKGTRWNLNGMLYVCVYLLIPPRSHSLLLLASLLLFFSDLNHLSPLSPSLLYLLLSSPSVPS